MGGPAARRSDGGAASMSCMHMLPARREGALPAPDAASPTCGPAQGGRHAAWRLRRQQLRRRRQRPCLCSCHMASIRLCCSAVNPFMHLSSV